MRRGAAKFERGLGRDWLDISDTADAVSAEDLCRLFHGLTETLRCQFVNGKVEWAFSFRCWPLGLARRFFFRCVQFVDLPMQCPPADPEFFCSRGYVSIRCGQRL